MIIFETFLPILSNIVISIAMVNSNKWNCSSFETAISAISFIWVMVFGMHRKAVCILTNSIPKELTEKEENTERAMCRQYNECRLFRVKRFNGNY